ncbi:DUF1269 domain-containing protein [Pseudomonas aeruginosa]|nr:DUF1269 domain-containing protein [Pseudomonas aeruginosa]EIU2673196.1 DUF1269 domain-containing protein [Pseudomonas aeruginosa]EIU2723025.1 DUF1269 domain-containing protein [Pseudomonas aeruginosa]EIU3319034.1 DUF1269 domain-containing protein [Pseudomonas aeruginosa]EIU3437556.1 DUF1269 domain-containing protein [Pseudomonas aeruginosa]
MSKYIAIFVDDEARAYDAARALRALHDEGSITVYSAGVLTKDKNGKIHLKGAADEGLVSTGLGALTGSALGILGGALVAAAAPAVAAGAAIAAGGLGGLATGTLVGSFWDIYDSGVSADFAREATAHLAEGKSAVMAEIDEDWQAPLDARIAEIGGTVVRTWRSDFEDRQAEAALEQDRREYEAAKAEWEASKAEAKEKAKKRLDNAKAKLAATEKRIRDNIDKFNAETKAKVDALEKQISSASAEAKTKLQKRVADLKEDRAKRSAKLNEAWKLTKEALF